VRDYVTKHSKEMASPLFAWLKYNDPALGEKASFVSDPDSILQLE